MATRRPFWKWHRWTSIDFGPWHQTTCIWNLNFKANSSYTLETMPTTEFRYWKIQYSHQAAPFSKWHCWKSLGFFPYTQLMCRWSLNMIFKAKLKLVRKPKNLIWSPGGHYESDIAENQQDSAHMHKQHVHEIWNWNSKAILSYAPETMSPTDGLADRQTDGQGDSSIYPTNFVGRGYNEIHSAQFA